MDDRKFARKFSRALSAVKKRRIQLGIPVFNSARHIWTPEDDKLLGTRPDDQVAAFIGTTTKAVGNRRRKFKVPACARQLDQARLARAVFVGRRKPGGHFGIYTPEEEKLMGTVPDEKLAEVLGRTRLAVQARRIQLKIPKFDARLHQWTPGEDALLGTMRDGELAARLGLSLNAVAHRRRRLGIPVYFAHRRPWTAEEDTLLGTATDTEIAARLGRHIATVCIRRQKLGIPNFYWQQRCGKQRDLSRKRKTPG